LASAVFKIAAKRLEIAAARRTQIDGFLQSPAARLHWLVFSVAALVSFAALVTAAITCRNLFEGCCLKHLIDLPGIGDALQYGLAFTRGNAVLQFC